MDLLPLILIAAGLLFAFRFLSNLRKATRKPEPKTFPYETRGTLFSPAERSFLGVLETALGDDYRVYGKVRLADVLKVKTPDRSAWQRAFNAISSKHVDYVITGKTDTRILAVIELDDKSHAKAKRQARDDFLNQALAAAAIPLVRVPAKAGYSVQELRGRLPLDKIAGPA